jgi:PPOX class probable F420-dependent enzyme
MPKGPVPAAYQDLLESTAYGHPATVGDDGRPEVNPVWFLWDGEHVLVGVRAATKKYRNLRRDPRVAISILDPAQPDRYLEIRGEVIDFERYDDLSFVNQLSRKYTGGDYARAVPEERYKLTIRVDAWTGQTE